MKQKITVGLVFGGKSTEHQISLLSAKNVYASLDRSLYDLVLIGIDKQGIWHICDDNMSLKNGEDVNAISIDGIDNPIAITNSITNADVINKTTGQRLSHIDVLFPILHGTYGEDGAIQGLAKMMNLPCVGCGIMGSAVGIDKDIMKHVLRSHGIGVSNGITLRKRDRANVSYNELSSKFGSDLFIKPAKLGSSVGVSMATDSQSFEEGLDDAFLYDNKVLIEERIFGREIECAVLGNENPEVALPGEVRATKGFYSYENKYLDETGAELSIPADLSADEIAKVSELAKQTYIALECRGMSRVDFFYTKDGQFLVNEINTIPGFTNISMYPKLWEASGLSQKDLVSKLISLAIEEHTSVTNLKLT